MDEQLGFIYKQQHNFIPRHNANQRKLSRNSVKTQRQTVQKLCCIGTK